jgi:hypothetical protein
MDYWRTLLMHEVMVGTMNVVLEKATL